MVATLDGYCLSLAKSFGLLEGLQVFDIPTALASLPESVRPDATERERIAATQFRSYEFQPRIAHWLARGIDVASEPYDISLIPDLVPCVWHADNFGNLKTSIEASDIPLDAKFLHTIRGVFPIVPRLRDVPDGEAACTVGSSGLGGRRFMELAVSRGSAGARYGLRAGDPLVPHGISLS